MMHPLFMTLKLEGAQNKFENTYMTPLPQSFNTTERIKIAVASIDLHLKSLPQSDNYLKIRLLEASNHHIVKSESNTLFVCALEKESLHVQIENINLAYLSFDNRSLNHLSFQFTTLSGKEIHLSEEYPSFIRLKLKDMMGPPDVHLYVEKKIDENGTILLDLANRLVLPQGYNWAMSLASVGFFNPNQHESGDFLFSCYYKDNYEKLIFVPQSENRVLAILRAFLTRITPDESLLRVEVTSKNYLRIVNNLQSPLIIQCNKDMGHLIGVDSAYNLSDKKVSIAPQSARTLNQPINMKRRPLSTLFVKSNVLNPSIVNQTYSSILRMTPSFSKEKNYCYKQFNTMEFVDIIPSSLSTIDFTFAAENNEPVPILPDISKEFFVHAIIHYFKV